MRDRIKSPEEDEDNKKINLNDLFIDLYEQCGLDIDRLRQKDKEKKD